MGHSGGWAFNEDQRGGHDLLPIGSDVEVLVEPRGARFGKVVRTEMTLLGDMIRVRYENGMPDGLFRYRDVRLV